VVPTEPYGPPKASDDDQLKQYLSKTKKDLLQQLRQKWQLGAGNLHAQLLERGLSAEQADMIAGLVVDIDDQLYNPLAPTINQEALETRVNLVLQLLN
jgi:hypothetical protein